MATTALLVGTDDGLYALGGSRKKALGGHVVRALTREGERWWAIADGRSIRVDAGEGSWKELAATGELDAHCLLPVRDALLVGTFEARLFELRDGALRPNQDFESIEGREAWHTPWGAPATTRTLSRVPDGPVYANIHVGGIARSDDEGRSWTASGLDIKADVHQVLALDDGRVLVAAAAGYGRSLDGGHSWTFDNRGLPRHYARAIAVGAGTVFMSASRGPRGGLSALYRRPLDGDAAFAKCERGLPEWFEGNFDADCVVTREAEVALGAPDGSVWLSGDAGESWQSVASGLPAVRTVAFN